MSVAELGKGYKVDAHLSNTRVGDGHMIRLVAAFCAEVVPLPSHGGKLPVKPPFRLILKALPCLLPHIRPLRANQRLSRY